MAKKITKRQAKHIARIMAGILLLNRSGEEFMDSNMTIDEEMKIYKEFDNRVEMILKDNEHQLSSSDEIVEYVREHF
jgi:ABC-type glutathione transport system ATPase component